MIPVPDETILRQGQGRPLLCALSGGGDSVALLLLLRTYCSRNGIPLSAAHVHHHLRGEEADLDAAYCEALCREYGVPFTRLDVFVPHGSAEEETARRMRYEALEACALSAADGPACIVTAHNADDVLETALFHLARGTGPAGLQIPPVRRLPSGVLILRPLTNTTGKALRDYLDGLGTAYRHDSTNDSPGYTRNAIRSRILPAMREIHPEAAVHSVHTLSLIAEDDAFLRDIAAGRLEPYPERDGVRILPCEALDAPHPVAARMVLLIHAMPDLTAAHITAVLAMASRRAGTEEAFLPGMRAVREYSSLRFVRTGTVQARTEAVPVPRLLSAGTFRYPGWTVTVTEMQKGEPVRQTFHNICVDSRSVRGILTLRTRRTGDRAAMYRGAGTATLKKLCIDRKIPREKRDTLPVLADDEGLCAAAGIGIAARCAEPEGICTGDHTVWSVRFVPDP